MILRFMRRWMNENAFAYALVWTVLIAIPLLLLARFVTGAVAVVLYVTVPVIFVMRVLIRMLWFPRGR
jgi:hypothetical protein